MYKWLHVGHQLDNPIDIACIDFSKAFDSVCHSKLICGCYSNNNRTWTDVWTERRERKRNDLTTTNPVYGCEELEHRVSVYDSIMEENVSVAEKQEKHDGVYLELLSDETEECYRGPQPPPPRPEIKPQSQHCEYEGLKDKEPDHQYLQLLCAETQGCNQQAQADDQDQDIEAQDRDNAALDRDQEQAIKPQDQDQNNPLPPRKTECLWINNRDNLISRIVEVCTTVTRLHMPMFMNRQLSRVSLSTVHVLFDYCLDHKPRSTDAARR